MRGNLTRLILGAGLLGTLALAAVGCGRRSDDYGKYVPSATTARTSLQAALDAWQEGQAPGKITSVSPAVQLVDSRRQGGQKLSGYEILSEKEEEGLPWFSVRLKLTGAKSEQVTRYVVVGINPIWVYSEEEYNKATHGKPAAGHH